MKQNKLVTKNIWVTKKIWATNWELIEVYTDRKGN